MDDHVSDGQTDSQVESNLEDESSNSQTPHEKGRPKGSANKSKAKSKQADDGMESISLHANDKGDLHPNEPQNKNVNASPFKKEEQS